MKAKKFIMGLFVILVMSIWFVAPGGQQAQAAFPEKPISFIVPYGAGGGTDGMARALAQRMEKELGVPVVVKNEKGSGGRRGSITLYKSKPDGYTIGFAHFLTLLYDETLGKKKNPIDYNKFTVVQNVYQTAFYIYVNKKSPFKSIVDFKNAGRPIKFGATGVGSPSWLVPQAVGSDIGFPVTYVTGFKNLAEAALAVARGDVDAAVASFKHIRGVLDDIRVLVYLSTQKAYKMPDVQTIQEAGYERLASLTVPWAIAAPPGAPEPRLEVIRSALRKIQNSKEFQNWAKEAGYSPYPQEPDAFWKSLQIRKEIYLGLKSRLQTK